MLFYTITGLINAVISGILGVFVYFKNRRDAVNRTFAQFCLAVVVWSYGYFMWQISMTPEGALFWSRGLMMGSIFIPITFFRFVITFLKILQKEKRKLVTGYFLAFFLFVSNFTSLFVDRVEPALSFPFWPKPGIFFHFFHLMFIGYAFYFWYLLSKAYFESSGIRKVQIKYILAGSLIGFLGGATNHFLWYGIPIPPFGNFLPALGFSLIAYAVLKHHLMNIRIILTEIFVASIGLILLIQAWMSDVFWTKALNWSVFILFCIFGYYLIKATIGEIQKREQIERMDKELRKTYKELKKLDIAKSEFISIASHQLRTPLTAIKGYASLISDKAYGEFTGKMRKPLRNIYSSVERLIKLVNDLLSISRIEAGKIKVEPEEFLLEGLINNVIEELGNLAKAKKLYLKWEASKKPVVKVFLDKAKIRQVVLNIVDNAIKYTQTGGITISYEQENGLCRIEIRDTGEGMTRAEISNLFKTFSRGAAGKRTWTEGAGLGLYIAKNFTEMHNGRIWVESTGKKKGSTFYVELPIKYEGKT